MPIKNTAENYGSVARWFHWVTALLFLASYCAIYYRQWFTEAKTPENMVAFQLHLSVGLTLAVIVALRIYWRFINRVPNPEPGTPLEHSAAHAGHYALYAIMIIMPITGYLGTGGATNFFFLFEIPKFADTQLYSMLVTDGLGLTFKEFEKPIDFVHKDVLGEWGVWLLIVGHVLAALYHQYVKGDRTISKMTG
ncbi:MAG: cytochrome b [Gammaproteobacteria bacterium]|nr:cytochrome b [Gammaproteobacteria bacterium]